MLCGSADAVSEALQLLLLECQALGLDLHLAKSELVTPAAAEPERLHELFTGSLLFDDVSGCSRVLTGASFEILGAPVGNATFCGAHTQTQVASALPSLEALSEIPDPQVGVRLLRSCASFAKLVYSSRTVPSECHKS